MARSELKIELSQSSAGPDVVIIRFDGELDSGSIERIEKCFQQIVDEGKRFAIVEMSGINFVSSAALGELMGGRKLLIERGGDLVFAGMNLDLRTKLSLMGANKIFRFYSDLRAAINAYKWEFGGHAETLKLRFPSNLRLVPPVRQLVSRIAKQKGYGNRDSFRIETIVDEICNNAVEHGKVGDNEHVDLKIQIDRDKIEIDVVNISDPDKVESLKAFLTPKGDDGTAMLDDRRGRGLALIKMLSNDLSVDLSERGTCVHVTKVREE